MKRASRVSKINKQFAKRIADIALQARRRTHNEEETRRWCIDLMCKALGYKSSELLTEAPVLGSSADIVAVDGDYTFLVIECKAATVKLTKAHVMQACRYAIALNTEWAVLTNGQEWHLYRVEPSKGGEPDIALIFVAELLDDDGVSANDAEWLYLLTKEAIFNGDTKQAYHDVMAMDESRLWGTLTGAGFMDVFATHLEASYLADKGVRATVDRKMLASYLVDLSDAIQEHSR
jgi:Type I restriction enzyme R protein N terminus (HSDR_N)